MFVSFSQINYNLSESRIDILDFSYILAFSHSTQYYIFAEFICPSLGMDILFISEASGLFSLAQINKRSWVLGANTITNTSATWGLKLWDKG